MSRAVDFAAKLLQSHPLSNKTKPQVSTGQASQDQEQPIKDVSLAPCTAADASAQAQASHQPEKWPKATPDEWKDIVFVVSRAFISLDWALSHEVTCDVPVEAAHRLTVLLAHLIQDLLIGHLPDLDLEVCALFTAGLEPVLTAQMAGYAEFTALAAAMISRLAMDRTVVPTGWIHARQIYIIFSKRNTLVCLFGQAAV